MVPFRAFFLSLSFIAASDVGSGLDTVPAARGVLLSSALLVPPKRVINSRETELNRLSLEERSVQDQSCVT